MFRFDDFVSAVVSKSRRHRVLTLLSRSLFGSGCIGLLLAIGTRLLPLSTFATALVQLAILLIVVAAPVVWALAATRHAFRVSDVLFDLDRKLDLEARISSLHVLSESHRPSVFYDRIAHAVEEGSEGWQRVYRLSRRAWSRFAIGLVCAISIVVLVIVGRTEPMTAPSISSDVGASTSADATAGSEDGDDLLSERDSTEDAPMDWIVQAFDDLLAARDPSLGVEPDVPEDFDAAAVESYTAALLDTLREDGGRPLSDDELDKLSSLADAAPMDLRDALEAILVEDDPEEVQSQLELIAEFARQQAQLEEMLAAEEGSAPDETSGFLPHEGQEASDEGGVYPMSGYEDDDMTPSLVEAPLTGEMGVSGEVYEYITGGVPIELPADGGVADEAERLTVDYARVQTILDTRALPQDAFETVRRYFELISSGGDT